MPGSEVTHCQVCGKTLAWRRAAQGVSVHPGCKRSLDPAQVGRAFARTQAILDRVREHRGDVDLGPLFVEATRQAETLLGNLRRMKNYVASPPMHEDRTEE